MKFVHVFFINLGGCQSLRIRIIELEYAFKLNKARTIFKKRLYPDVSKSAI